VLLDLGDLPPVRARSRPEAEQLFLEAQALEDSDPARARALYAQLLTMTPDNADAHVNLGRLFHEVGRLAEARNHYRAALSLRPRDATAAYNLAVSLGDEGRTAEAMQWYHSRGPDPQLAGPTTTWPASTSAADRPSSRSATSRSTAGSPASRGPTTQHPLLSLRRAGDSSSHRCGPVAHRTLRRARQRPPN
jgi:Tfp pilus assembly protein PilF